MTASTAARCCRSATSVDSPPALPGPLPMMIGASEATAAEGTPAEARTPETDSLSRAEESREDECSLFAGEPALFEAVGVGEG